MCDWAISLSGIAREKISSINHDVVRIPEFLSAPNDIVSTATLQKFAKITPQYPGIRAPLPHEVSQTWLSQLAGMLDENFGEALNGWEMQAWFSLVTTPAQALLPMQRFPHVDGTDPSQIAMMLYLHRTAHGGTGFYRHLSTGLEALTEETFSRYRDALHSDVERVGLPEARYVTDGAPLFERIHETDGAYNEAVFYRGNLLHSGLIDETIPLSSDPAEGRLTINAFFRPKA